MIRKVITLMLTIAALIGIMCYPVPAVEAASEQTSEAYIPSEPLKIMENEIIVLKSNSIEYVDTDDKTQLSNLIAEMKQRKSDAHSLAEAARALGYDEEHSIIVLAKKEWNTAHTYMLNYTTKYNEIIKKEEEAAAAAKQAQRDKYYKEYPAAATIWFYLKNLGYNDYVCAGILGNIMAEVGGNTLNIQYWLTGSGRYYGMCQWSRGYSQVWGKDLNGQCAFLASTIKYEMNTYGYAYASGFNYSKFLALTNEQAAAKAFAKCYERCGSSSYSTRQRNATVAYKYFTS
jgi:hypothetical protein